MIFRRELAAALCALGLVACSAAAGGADTVASTTDVSGTVGGVGVLPGTVVPSAPIDPSTTSTSTTAVPVPVVAIGTSAKGNRVLMIGDSILASTSKRYGNEMCDAVVPLGWRVEVDAEVSRDISFGTKVLESRMPDGWDAGLIFLGTNFNRNGIDFLKRLNAMINAFDGRPLILVTATEWSTDQATVNEIIRNVAVLYPNVSVVEWSKATAAEPSLLGRDGIHPTAQGRIRLVADVAALLGPAPAGPANATGGRCLDSTFIDDSAGTTELMPDPTVPTTTTAPTVPPTTAASTTTRPSVTVAPTTTVRSTTTIAGSTTTLRSTTTTSTATTTAAPTTAAATTAAPTTAAATTAAPTTAPPTVP